MKSTKDLKNLVKFCEDFQEQVHLRKEITESVSSLRFSCDLLLRNMIMMAEKENNGESFSEELYYITNNLLGAHAHLTGIDALTTAKKYDLML